jgi:hypothetical protein
LQWRFRRERNTIGRTVTTKNRSKCGFRVSIFFIAKSAERAVLCALQ